MALKHLTLPNGTTLDINDARSVVIGDDIYNVVALTSEEYQALPVKDENTLYIVTDSSGSGGGGGGDITPSATVHNSLISIIMNEETVGSFTTNSANAVNIDLGTVITQIKTINNQSLIGTGNITISGGGGSGDENVIEIVKVNGTALTPDANKAVNVTVPTESTVSGWGFTKNTGTYSKPSGGIPATDLASAVQTSLGKADTALQSYTETDPTVPSWAKTSSKPTYTASEVGALPDTTVIPAAPGTLKTNNATAQTASASESLSGTINLHKVAKTGTYSDLIGTPTIPTETTVSGWGFTKNAGTVTGVKVNGTTKTPTSGTVDIGTVLTSYTETDPVYSASAAAGITSSDITNWNGKTSNVGTITGITMNGSSKGTSGVVNLGTVVTSETDPVFTASAAHGISSADISNWNAKQKAITVSSSEPTSSQGSNGDIWIVI